MYRQSRGVSRIGLLLLATLILHSIALAMPSLTGSVQAEISDDTALTLKLVGPIYAQAGKTLTYSFTVENVTAAQTFTDIGFFNDVPANTTHVSGGVLETDANTGQKFVRFSIASLAPHAKRTISWVARVDNNVTVGTTIDNGAYAVESSTPSAVVGYYPGVSTTVEAPGTLLAIIKNSSGRAFNVNIDGYQFENYGNDPGRNANDDLGVADMFQMFGKAACKSGTTATTCVLSGPAKEWMESQNSYMKGGHCDGFSATSMRFFQSLPYRGKSSPATFQSGAANTINLNLNQPIENYIAYYWTTQVLDEVSSQKYIASPVSIVQKLIEDFNHTPSITHAAHIFVLPGWKNGHSIAPYGVEKVTDNEYRILVYDNNYPKQRTYITVNMAANTWRYVTASSPGQPTNVYEGTADSQNLQLLPTAARDLATNSYFDCPFCQPSMAGMGGDGAVEVQPTITVQFAGEGAFVVINDDGLMTGEDPADGLFYEEIPGATVTYFNGGLNKAVPPLVTIPFSSTTDFQFQVTVHGRDHISSSVGTLTVVGPGYTVTVNDIVLAANEEYKIAFSPSGQSFAYTATKDQEAPHIQVAYNPVAESDPSIIFGVRGIQLTPTADIYLDIDPVKERVYVQDNAAAAQNYSVDMEFIWPDGNAVTTTEILGVPEGISKIGIDFGAWDGLLEPAIYVDDILDNPKVNHRLMVSNITGSYTPAAHSSLTGGIYQIDATFTNVTPVQLTDIYFTVAGIGEGHLLLNADGGPAGAGGRLSIPASALGEDGVLSMNESVTTSFSVQMSSTGIFVLTLDANGVPHDWTVNAPQPVGQANNAPFNFAVQSNFAVYLSMLQR